MANASDKQNKAFDETAWSTDPELRARCLEQLRAALEESKEELRSILVAEAGSPHMLTYVVQVDQPIQWLSFWPEMARGYQYSRDLPEAEMAGERSAATLVKEPIGVVGAITAAVPRSPSTSKGAHSRTCAGSVSASHTFSGA